MRIYEMAQLDERGHVKRRWTTTALSLNDAFAYARSRWCTNDAIRCEGSVAT